MLAGSSHFILKFLKSIGYCSYSKYFSVLQTTPFPQKNQPNFPQPRMLRCCGRRPQKRKHPKDLWAMGHLSSIRLPSLIPSKRNRWRAAWRKNKVIQELQIKKTVLHLNAKHRHRLDIHLLPSWWIENHFHWIDQFQGDSRQEHIGGSGWTKNHICLKGKWPPATCSYCSAITPILSGLVHWSEGIFRSLCVFDTPLMITTLTYVWAPLYHLALP